MGSVRIYVATSADGFIADRDGGVEWLGPFDPRNYGYERFVANVGAVVMGRRTFDHVQTFADDWPYTGRRSYVLTSRPVGRLPAKDIKVAGGPIVDVIAAARAAAADRDVWIVGGAVTMGSALEQSLVDRVEVFYVPVLLGAGIPFLGQLKRRVDLSFEGMETFPDGVVKLAYQPRRQGR